MTPALKLLPLAAAVLLSSACSTTSSSLVFASANTVGISISGSAADTGGQFTLGYKSQDVAIIPTYFIKPGAIAQGDADEASPYQLLGAYGPGGDAAASDSYSVFAQFSANTPTGLAATNSVGLNKFFSTGVAAQALAGGFACKLAMPATAPANFDPSKCIPNGLGVTPAH